MIFLLFKEKLKENEKDVLLNVPVTGTRMMSVGAHIENIQ